MPKRSGGQLRAVWFAGVVVAAPHRSDTQPAERQLATVAQLGRHSVTGWLAAGDQWCGRNSSKRALSRQAGPRGREPQARNGEPAGA